MSVAFVPSAAFWTGIAGIVVAGVIGPAIGYWAGARADGRRFRHDEEQKAADHRHDRQLKASDDLRERLDDVAAGLEELGEACAQLRGRLMMGELSPDRFGEELHERVGETFTEAGDAQQRARVRIERLEMRPHAPAETVATAKAAADSFGDAIQMVHEAIVAEAMAATAPSDYVTGLVTTTRLALADLPARVENGYERTRGYTAAARVALERLVGTPEQ